MSRPGRHFTKTFTLLIDCSDQAHTEANGVGLGAELDYLSDQWRKRESV